jgi:hypothetical protein
MGKQPGDFQWDEVGGELVGRGEGKSRGQIEG